MHKLNSNFQDPKWPLSVAITKSLGNQGRVGPGVLCTAQVHYRLCSHMSQVSRAIFLWIIFLADIYKVNTFWKQPFCELLNAEKPNHLWQRILGQGFSDLACFVCKSVIHYVGNKMLFIQVFIKKSFCLYRTLTKIISLPYHPISSLKNELNVLSLN